MNTLFLYWGGRNLSWLRYLTVKSFKRHNPEWKIKVYYPVKPTIGSKWHTTEQSVGYDGQDWFSELDAEPLPFDMETIGFSNDIPEVHKSDLFRLWVIHEYGGVYSDFDILYTKPFPEVKGTIYCWHPDGHYSVGLIGGEKGSKLYADLLSMSKESGNNKYQVYGSTLWGKLDAQPEGWNIPKNLVYSYGWQDVERLFTKTEKLPEEAIGVHWYGGSELAGWWENRIAPGNIPSSTIGKIIKEYA